jgi:broad specificity phosphatase PhoE
MIELVMIRHGQTEWNASGRFQGRSDVALTEVGKIQAKLIQRALEKERFDRAYSSPLRRALETARIILEPHALEPVVEPRLREFDFGAWEGLTWEEIKARFPSVRKHEITSAKAYAPEGGERFDDVVARAMSFIQELRGFDGARVLAVTHAGVLHAILEIFRNDASRRVSFVPASVSRFEMTGDRYRVVLLNDITHLDFRLSS